MDPSTILIGREPARRPLLSVILTHLSHRAAARAACVSKSWRTRIDSDGDLWRDLLAHAGLWFGGDSERAFVAAIHARRTRHETSVVGAPPPPHPYKELLMSRHLTRTRWIDSPTPRHLTFPAHGTSVVTCLLFSRGRIISASDDHSILVHSPITGELLRSLDGHEGGVWALAATKDTLVSGSTDRTVRIWDLSTGQCTHVFGGHTSTVRSLAVVKPEWVERERWPKRPLIVTGSRDRSLRVWTLPHSGDAGGDFADVRYLYYTGCEVDVHLASRA
jgi:F-box and WD-40 domain protein CDC4